jgi:hypothetical protein
VKPRAITPPTYAETRPPANSARGSKTGAACIGRRPASAGAIGDEARPACRPAAGAAGAVRAISSARVGLATYTGSGPTARISGTRGASAAGPRVREPSGERVIIPGRAARAIAANTSSGTASSSAMRSASPRDGAGVAAGTGGTARSVGAAAGRAGDGDGVATRAVSGGAVSSGRM